MPNTRQGEIANRVNAKEAAMVRQSKKLVSKTREITADTNAKNRARAAGTNKRRSFPQSVTQPVRDATLKSDQAILRHAVPTTALL